MVALLTHFGGVVNYTLGHHGGSHGTVTDTKFFELLNRVKLTCLGLIFSNNHTSWDLR